MKLDKAIEILEVHFTNSTIHKGHDTYNAIKLGIEALKYCHRTRRLAQRIENINHRTFQEFCLPLPGETKG